MSATLMIDLVRQAVRGRYRLQWLDKYSGYFLEKRARVYASQKDSQALKLDYQKPHPFHFFSESPPPDLKKMCDAIVLHRRQDRIFCTLIELKTGDPGDSEQQLANGMMFCQWLVGLIRHHRGVPQDPVTYFGVLVWEPKDSVSKGPTVRKPPKAKPHDLFDKFFDIRDLPHFGVDELIDSPIT